MTQKRPVEPKDLFRLRLITDAQISPDGSRVAFVISQMDEEKNDYVRNIHVVDRKSRDVRQFTNGDKDSSPRWSPDGRWLAFLSGRKDRAQIHLLSTGGGESVALTDRKLGAGTPEWSPDSARIAFVASVSTDEEEEKETKDDKKPAKTKITERSSYKFDGGGYLGHRRRHIFVVDVKEKKVEQLTDGDFHDDSVAWSPDGQHVAFSSRRDERWDVSPERDVFVMPATGGKARQVTSGGSYFAPIFSPDGSRIAVVGNEDPDVFRPARIFSMNRDGSDLTCITPNFDGSVGYDVIGDIVSGEGGEWDWRKDGLYFLGTERGVSNVYCTNGKVSPITQGRHAISSFSVAGDGTIAYTGADIVHPSEVYIWEGKSGKQLTHENDAWLNEVQITEPERFVFSGAKGEENEGWLLPPRGHESGKHPLIVYIHGGPQASYGETPFFEYQYLAAQGFGVFFPNIHGSSTYGVDYQLSIREDWGNLDYQDVLAGTEEAASRPWVDRNRLGMAGGSYGGYMTSWTIGHTDQFKAAVVERCLCNFISFFGTSDGGWMWKRTTGAYPEEDVNKLWDMSPIKYVANVKTPTLVIHSEQDLRTPIEQGEQYFNALRRLGNTKTKLIMFPEESHGLSRGGKPSRRVDRLNYISDWFKENL